MLRNSHLLALIGLEGSGWKIHPFLILNRFYKHSSHVVCVYFLCTYWAHITIYLLIRKTFQTFHPQTHTQSSPPQCLYCSAGQSSCSWQSGQGLHSLVNFMLLYNIYKQQHIRLERLWASSQFWSAGELALLWADLLWLLCEFCSFPNKQSMMSVAIIRTLALISFK